MPNNHITIYFVFMNIYFEYFRIRENNSKKKNLKYGCSYINILKDRQYLLCQIKCKKEFKRSHIENQKPTLSNLTNSIHIQYFNKK